MGDRLKRVDLHAIPADHLHAVSGAGLAQWWEGRTCGGKHPLGRLGPAATVSLSYVTCPGCPANTDGRGHDVAYCRTTGCQKPAYPIGHVGEVPPQR